MANLNETPKIALVTGSSRGLGRSTALSLGSRGVGVVVTYHSQADQAREVVDQIKQGGGTAVALRLDTSNVSGFEAFITEFKAALQQTWGVEHFDYLVNNAGTGMNKPFTSVTEEDFDTLLNIHFKGVFFLTQKLLPLLQDGGRIVNLSTGLARFTFPGYSAYASMKGAIETLTRYLAKELGPRGIAVNAVAPGAIETDFSGAAIRNSPELKAQIAGMTAMGRVGVAEDIGPMIASLLSDDNRWVTGQRIEVSGGMIL